MPTYRDKIDGTTFEAASPEAARKLMELKHPDPPDEKMAAYTKEALDPITGNRAISREQGRSAGQGQALGLGLQQGALRQFADEVGAATAASGLPVGTPPIIGAPIGAARMLADDPQAEADYNRALEHIRGFQEGAREAHPLTTLGGEIAGGFAGPGPGGGIPGTMLRGTAEGTVTGVGAGEDAASRTAGGLIGGAIGGTIAGTLPLAWNKVKEVGRGLLGQAPPAASALGAREGTQMVADALNRDFDAADPLMDQWRNAVASRTGQSEERVLADQGGQNVQDLARNAANANPDAWNRIKNVAQERFTSQGERFTDWWGRRSSLDTADQLREQARSLNRPAYDAAYARGAAGIWDEGLQDMTTGEAMQAAIRKAVGIGRDYAGIRGQVVPRNPFREVDGELRLAPGERPTLEFWDHVQRGLREVAEEAPRGGEKATRINEIRRQLNERLDAQVPEFQTARRGAAAFFGAEDALDAGRDFLKNPMGNQAEAKRALGRMNEAERRLFRMGLEESVLEKVRGASDSRDIAKLMNSPELRERLEMGLGGPRAREFTDYIAIERGMNRLKDALGNSTTAKQLIGAGTFGGTAAAYGYGTDNTPLTVAGGAQVLRTFLRRGNTQLTQAAADRVARLLTSQDQGDIDAVLRAMQNNPAVRKAVHGAMGLIENATAQQSGREGAD